MEDAILVSKIVNLWQDSGAKLHNQPERVSYLNNQKRPDKPQLYLRFGVPITLHTQEAIYNFSNKIHGRVSSFASKLSHTFDYIVVSPEDANKDSLLIAMLQNSELCIAIDTLKPHCAGDTS